MVVFDIIKWINGSNHDFEPHLMEELKISIGGSRDVKFMCNHIQHVHSTVNVFHKFLEIQEESKHQILSHSCFGPSEDDGHFGS